MAAATLMLDGGIGLLRTMPPPRREAVERLRAAATGLASPWPDGQSLGRVVAAVDPADPRGAAFLDQAAELMRGAGYTAFDGAAPEQTGHGGVAAPYAHVTAPLRRLADRYATEVCLALFARRRAVPDWAREALPKLPEVMAGTDRVAARPERGAVDLAEAVLLRAGSARRFDAAVVDVDEPKPNRRTGRHGRARRPAGARRGARATCRSASASGCEAGHRRPAKRTVLFERA